MNPSILKQDLDQEFYTDERCFITELSNHKDDPQLSIARARLEPGVTTRWHELVDTIERYCIISGRGLVEIGDLPATEVAAGDIVLIPAGCRQRITNTGHDQLLFLAICSPRFRQQNYHDIDDRAQPSRPSSRT